MKGKREVEFGHKVNLATGRSNLILDCWILDGNPADSAIYTDVLNNIHKRGFELFRCEWKTRERFDAKVYWNVIVYNILVMRGHVLLRCDLRCNDRKEMYPTKKALGDTYARNREKVPHILFMSKRAQNTKKMSGLRVTFHVLESEKREFIHRL